jgi:hypothetical protein
MRVFLGVVTGYMIFVVSTVLLFQFTQQDPHGTPSLAFAIGSVLWGMAFAGMGGFMAARIGHGNSLLPGLLVGAIIAAGAVLSLMKSHHEPIWTELSALLLMAPAAFSGGLLNRRMQSLSTSAIDRGPASSR